MNLEDILNEDFEDEDDEDDNEEECVRDNLE